MSELTGAELDLAVAKAAFRHKMYGLAFCVVPLVVTVCAAITWG